MLHQSACECGDFDCPANSGSFYVSIRNDNGDYRFLLGPFMTHAEALAAVTLGEYLAQVDPRAHWYAYGTCRTEQPVAPERVIFRPCPACGEITYHGNCCGCSKG